MTNESDLCPTCGSDVSACRCNEELKAPHFIGLVVGKERILINFFKDEGTTIIVEKLNLETNLWEFFHDYKVGWEDDSEVFNASNELVRGDW